MIDIIGLSATYILEQIMKDEDLMFRKIHLDFVLGTIEAMLKENEYE